MTQTVALSSFQPTQPDVVEAPAGFPGETVARADFPIEITAKALDMIRSALDETKGEDGEYLRVGVKGGGCSGFQYSLNFTGEVDDEDILVLVDGTKIVTDAFS